MLPCFLAESFPLGQNATKLDRNEHLLEAGVIDSPRRRASIVERLPASGN